MINNTHSNLNREKIYYILRELQKSSFLNDSAIKALPPPPPKLNGRHSFFTFSLKIAGNGI